MRSVRTLSQHLLSYLCYSPHHRSPLLESIIGGTSPLCVPFIIFIFFSSSNSRIVLVRYAVTPHSSSQRAHLHGLVSLIDITGGELGPTKHRNNFRRRPSLRVLCRPCQFRCCQDLGFHLPLLWLHCQLTRFKVPASRISPIGSCLDLPWYLKLA